jgi:hypothetical protein
MISVDTGSSRRWRRALLAAFVGLLACDRNRIYLESVEIPGDSPTNDKIEIARAIATQAGHDRLAAEAKRRFPFLTARQLSDLVLTWRVYPPSAESRRERVALIIGYRPIDPSFDPRPVVEYCKEVLAKDLAIDR